MLMKIFWFCAAAATLLANPANAQDWEILPGIHLTIPFIGDEGDRSINQLDCSSLHEICLHKNEFAATGVAGCRRYHKLCE